MHLRTRFYAVVFSAVLILAGQVAGAMEIKEAQPLGLTPPATVPEVIDTGLGEDGLPYPVDHASFGSEARTHWLLGKVEPAVEEVKESPQNQQPAYAELPVIDPELLATAKSSGDESIRVIIHLNYMPHALLKDGVRDAHAMEMAALKAQIDTINRRYADVRVTSAPTDAENYSSMFDILPEDRAAMAALNEQHEALSLVMQREFKQVLQAEIEPYQEPVVAALLALGAQVEFTTLSGNAIIALVPVEALPDVAEIPRVARIAPDELIHSNLDIADDATLVTSTMTGGGLWNNGFTGGIYDPAILDSGTDRTHPFMENQTYRTNHWSWYLVAGAADPNYDPNEGSYFQDDLQGHGSHVAGIVGSLGSVIYPNHRGMSYGVEKFVTLKAAFRNTASGGASMYASDRMNLTDRALFRTAELYPTFGTNDFNDDVDGFNLSYGGATTSDDNDSSRFIDSVIADTLADTPWTVSAGNSGPSNTNFNSPAISYNAITVAAADDLDTTSRSDDVLASYSSRGPTANGRKKPDLAAPGSDIKSANQNWETQTDWIEKSGTSMAAPMVLGVAMDLMDAGVWRELSIKALLINTAQKNEAGYNFESDADGWDPGMGWGYMNAWAAYFHRADVKETTLAASGQPGDYRLYKGVMRDEGAAGEGRDRATMVWRRHATYSPNTFPATYYNLSDLDLRMYNEDNGAFIDSDATVRDNVHQVRVDSGAGATPVVIKPYSYSTSFPHGGATETFALSTEEGFVEVAFPDLFGGFVNRPATVQPNEEFTYQAWVRNDSVLASHVNTIEFLLPTGWSIVSGANPQNIGSIAGGGTQATTRAEWTLRAQATPQAAVVANFTHSHSSYAESYGPQHYGVSINVVQDVTPPTPNPSTWASVPIGTSSSQISMTATTATDAHGPVEYYFDFTSAPMGGAGGSDSGWTTSTSYTDSGLGVNNSYCYRVTTRDNPTTTPNQTAYSSTICRFSLANPPGAGSVAVVGTDTLRASWSANGNPAWTGYYVENMTNGNNSGWITTTTWDDSGLVPGTYSYRVKAHNANGIETSWTSLGSGTLVALPDLPFSDGFESGNTTGWSNTVP